MGQGTSESLKIPSFDRTLSTTESIDHRAKNIPLDSTNQIKDTTPKLSTSDEKPVRLVENTLLVWLDSTLEHLAEPNKAMLFQFHRIINTIKTFHDADACFNFMNAIKTEKIFLIVSGSLGRQIIERVKDLDQIHSIYVFCGNKANNEQWVKPFKKIKGIHTKVKELNEALKQDFLRYDRSVTSISIFPPGTLINELNDSNKEFVYMQLLKSILLELNYEKNFHKDLVNFCRPYYKDGEQQLRIVDTFETNYPLHEPIWWYTRKCFIYMMLRKAFYRKDFEIMCTLAFFIRDLHRDIRKSYAQVHNYQYAQMTVYRSTSVTNAELARLQKSVGGILAFDDFLMTTIERNVAIKLGNQLSAETNSMGILYTIHIDPVKSSMPYISLNNLSYSSNADSAVLFSIDAIFRIEQIDRVNDHLYEVHLFPATKRDEDIKYLIEFMQGMIEDFSGWYKLAKVMLDIKEYDYVIKIYQRILAETKEEEREQRAFLHHELGYLNDMKGDWASSIDQYTKALDIYLSYLHPRHQKTLTTYTNLANVSEKQGKLIAAYDYYEKALLVEVNDDPNAVLQHNNIGRILQKQQRYVEALQSYEKAAEILIKYFPSAYPLLADTYHNIAGLHYIKHAYSKALIYYKKALEADDQSPLGKNPNHASTCFNVATTYECLQDQKRAIKYAEKAVQVSQSVFGKEHAETIEYMNYLEQLKNRSAAEKV